MKITARILSILLALVMVVGISTTALAADYEVVEPGAFKGIPADATDKVYISADGEDADEIPDLVKGWYIYNSDDLTFAGRKTPAWDTFYGSSFYVKSITNWWVINAGSKCETQNGGGKDEKGSYREKDGVKFYSHKIYVGLSSAVNGHSIPLEHGIGVKPSKIDNPQENYVLVNAEGYGYFYAITGITGSAYNQNKTNTPTEYGGSGTKGPDSNTASNTVIYEIWGSPNAIADTDTESKANDASFKLLATGEISANNTGEFNVKIAGYKTLKLVTKVVGTKTQSNGGTECVWGEASLYNMPGTTPAPTGDNFAGIVIALSVLSAGAIITMIRKREN